MNISCVKCEVKVVSDWMRGGVWKMVGTRFVG
jgi:hypothetical protein